MPLTNENLRRIRQIQIQTTRNVDDLFAGIYRSAFKGQGLEFEEVREYQSGDDVRQIDWNVTARLSSPYVKTFREERELTVILAVDISASGHFAHLGVLKSERMAEIAAVLAFSAIKNSDKVGLILFSSEIELYLPPAKGINHVLRVIRELLLFKPKHSGTNLKKMFHFIGKVQKKQCVCFILSDFLTSEIFNHKAKICAEKHDLIAIQVTDSYENALPPLGLFTLKDLESGDTRTVDLNEDQSRSTYQRESQLWLNGVKEQFILSGISFLRLNTSENYTAALRNFFKLRGQKK